MKNSKSDLEIIRRKAAYEFCVNDWNKLIKVGCDGGDIICINDIDGECEHCGAFTIDESAIDNCCWSPEICKVCGYRPCDDSC